MTRSHIPIGSDIELAAAIAGGGGGSGGTPAGSDGEIQFNDGDAFGASPDFVWDSGILKLVATENGTAEIRANAPGVQLQLFAADGDATHVGGEIVIQSGESDGQNGGDLTIRTGSDGGGGDSGNITIATGAATDGKGGDIDIRPNPGSVHAGQGGSVNIVGGTGQTGSGGSVVIQAGNKVSGGSNGSVQLYSADGNQAAELNNNGFFLPGLIDVSSLPTSDPAAAGQMWNDAGTLKVSAG